MSTPVFEQNKAYRKGVILGLTMAEITILIIFCLLIASALIVEEKESKIEILTAKNIELTQVKDALDQLRAQAVNPNKIDDLFQELKRMQEQAAKGEKAQIQLDKITKENIQLQKIKEIVDQKISQGITFEDASRDLAADAQYAKDIKNALKDTPFQDNTPQALSDALKASGDLAKAIAGKSEATIEAERLKGQLANARKQLERVGKGTEMPACWADPKTGKPEYIFKIDLTSNGLIIHNQQLSNRVEEQKLLPLNTIIFDQEIGQNAFRLQTAALAQWSIQHGCRFFVIAKDSTQGDEKDIYKTMSRTLEEHFYKFETK